MPPASQHALFRKLSSIFDLTSAEREAVTSLPFHVREYGPRQDISRDHDRPTQCCVILEGMACRYKIIRGGGRQILSLHIAGDIPDLHSLHLDVMDHNLGTLSHATVGLVHHDLLRNLMRAHPRLGDAFWRTTLIDAAVFREWITGLGARSAFARLAHLLCELFVRQRAIGQTAGFDMPLTLTQGEIGEALGLSLVHVNRTFKALRAAHLIETHRSSLTIRDWPGLQFAGEFDPAYLHLRQQTLGPQ
jgi:CRP-like cAMP-binding protein